MENLDPFSPPNREDEKMARFGFRAAYISLFWVVGKVGFAVPFYFDQDCSQHSPFSIYIKPQNWRLGLR